MEIITIKIHAEMKEYMKQFTFECHSIEEIESRIDKLGYKKATIEDASKYIYVLYFKPYKRRYIEKHHEVECPACRDGGCVHCEPWRFGW